MYKKGYLCDGVRGEINGLWGYSANGSKEIRITVPKKISSAKIERKDGMGLEKRQNWEYDKDLQQSSKQVQKREPKRLEHQINRLK